MLCVTQHSPVWCAVETQLVTGFKTVCGIYYDYLSARVEARMPDCKHCLAQLPATDSTGKPVRIGSRVRWRGAEYTITEILPGERFAEFRFKEPLHIDEVPDELGVDLVCF